MTTAGDDARLILERLGIGGGAGLDSRSPIDGSLLGSVSAAGAAESGAACDAAATAFRRWRSVPAPRRGELVRMIGEELRREKETLARLVTLEAGKIVQEGLGEVQEMIDICDFAVGLSRQLYGSTIASERPEHRMMEQWHPLGPVLVISAFNFPVAVWAWNAALALVCGDPVIWKPSEKTPLTAAATMALVGRALERFGADAPPGLVQCLQGGRALGERLVDDPRIALVSATGSTAMGRAVGPRVAQRFGRVLLELGGNNAMIVAPSADLELAARAILFSAVGTAGQRCTTLRRLIVHESVAAELSGRLVRLFAGIAVGDPRDPGTLIGPLIDASAFAAMQRSLDEWRAAGARVHGGELAEGPDGGCYVRPALVELEPRHGNPQREVFAPILQLMRYSALEEAIALNNAVPQGLSSAIFTTDLREAERFLAAAGSDCGIANVNIGPSGAEIGGAFGGEKETGGGRESGSDSWRAYMRRQTSTVNYGTDLPLAQGIRFDVAP
ncbi:aldehyde dehydrogenase family protein [Sphingomonas ginkgonis]|uniref:aldehyde dehydrogenase (NAD(+)) n=1 Tax=Sphingomonas ginkgonis TaxID=2315330 RepID=A0A3R9WSH4_9SPHN|nr:aldehyde dehydrogenase family protein [Sphingomonas ginkgonis]RST30695.1 aldehyde dehydrogenase family protein [Sphingomonas ginkgonis]